MQAVQQLQKTANFWSPANGKARCNACKRFCVIAENQKGVCGVRKNISGKLVSLVYGRALTKTVDPIEKKPLFHFFPGARTLSISTYGCNFRCEFCQNFDISQEFLEQEISSIPFMSPEEIVSLAIQNGLKHISYTYTEPTVFVEYALDTMKLAKEKGLKNNWVSNGYMSKEVLEAIAPYLDAINVDLKGDKKFYSEICGGIKIEGVKENISLLHKRKIHLEVTMLLIPTKNDSEQTIKENAEFIASVDKKIPMHFSAFYPAYKLSSLPATPAETVLKAKEIAESAGLEYVYAGNLGMEENTYCPKCKNLLVSRQHYFTQIPGLREGKCSKCGTKADFVQ